MFAALVQGPLVRLVPFGLLLVALQRTIFVELTVAGVIIQVATAFAAAAGVVGGPERGALAGFVVGVIYDLAEGLPLGSTALAMIVAGVVAGAVSLITVEPQWWLSAIFVGLGSAAGELMVPTIRLFTGEPAPYDARLWLIVPVVGAAGALLSPLLLPLARWCLRVRQAEWKAPPDDVTV